MTAPWHFLVYPEPTATELSKAALSIRAVAVGSGLNDLSMNREHH